MKLYDYKLVFEVVDKQENHRTDRDRLFPNLRFEYYTLTQPDSGSIVYRAAPFEPFSLDGMFFENSFICLTNVDHTEKQARLCYVLHGKSQNNVWTTLHNGEFSRRFLLGYAGPRNVGSKLRHYLHLCPMPNMFEQMFFHDFFVGVSKDAERLAGNKIMISDLDDDISFFDERLREPREIKLLIPKPGDSLYEDIPECNLVTSDTSIHLLPFNHRRRKINLRSI